MKTNPHETAFPTGAEGDPGLTKLEYMTTEILKGFCANPAVTMGMRQSGETPRDLADNSVIYARALIAALNEQPA